MAQAKIDGLPFEVRITQDLTDNWAIEVIQPRGDRRFLRPYDASPEIVIKVRADTRESALKAGLELLKKHKQIDDYFI